MKHVEIPDPMKWKAKSNAEAGEILKMLARQGEPLLKKLDEKFSKEENIKALFEQPASNDAIDRPDSTIKRAEILAG